MGEVAPATDTAPSTALLTEGRYQRQSRFGRFGRSQPFVVVAGSAALVSASVSTLPAVAAAASAAVAGEYAPEVAAAPPVLPASASVPASRPTALAAAPSSAAAYMLIGDKEGTPAAAAGTVSVARRRRWERRA